MTAHLYVKINIMSTNANQALSRIKVTVETGHALSNGAALQRRRRAVQIGTLLLAVLIPVSGLFRIDPAAATFVILGRQIWFSDFALVAGFWLALASALIITYSTLGTVFCGWSCPQNTLSEWADRMTRKFLGRHAEVSLEGEALHVSAGKRKWLSWALLGGLFLAASMGLALIPLFYFYPPEVVWSFITLRNDARLAPSLYWIYTIFVLIVFVDVAVVRHFFCRFMCIYRVWQHSFKTRHTLHIAYDATRGARCAACNYCVRLCPVDIDPRNTTTYDSCINCGLCVSACDSLQFPKAEPGLLFFEFGERKLSLSAGRMLGVAARLKNNLGTLKGRIAWVAPAIVMGLVMFGWGSAHYQPYHLSVYRADSAQETAIHDYRIDLANKLYRPALLKVSVSGLPADRYQLSTHEAVFDSAGRRSLTLHLNELPKGLYTLIVQAESNDGWHTSYRVQHYAGGTT